MIGLEKKKNPICYNVNFVNVFMYLTQNSYLNGIATLEDKEVDAWFSNSKCYESIKR